VCEEQPVGSGEKEYFKANGVRGVFVNAF